MEPNPSQTKIRLFCFVFLIRSWSSAAEAQPVNKEVSNSGGDLVQAENRFSEVAPTKTSKSVRATSLQDLNASIPTEIH